MNAYSTSELIVIFKISERCNLKCDYCYFFFSGDDSWKLHPAVAGPDVVQALGHFCQRAAEDYGLKKIRIIFHGGEPLLMRRPKFLAMCNTLRSYETTFTFSFGLQTNAVLVNEEWIQLFSEQKIGIGVSLDGPEDINDRHRLDMKGRGTYERTVAGLRLLKQAGEQGRISRTGLLCVANPEASGEEIYRHFVDDLGITSMNFLWPDYSHDSKPSPETVAAIESFMLDALRAWLRSGRKDVYVRFFSGILCALADRDTGQKYSEVANDYRNLIGVSSNGDIGPEDTLHGLSERFASTGMSVASNSVRDIFGSDIWIEQAAAANIRPDGCTECDWWKICKGGKPANRFSRADGFNNPSIFCNGLQEIYSETAAYLVRNGAKVEDIIANLTDEVIAA